MVHLVASRLAELLSPALDGSTTGRAPAAGGAGELNQIVARGLRGLVLDGRLVVGTKIPSERALAAELGFSRSTVTSAYRRLRDEGYLTGSHGAGSNISLPATGTDRPDSDRVPGRQPDYDLTVAALPAPALLAEAAADAAAALPALLAGHGLHPLGLQSLRSAVAARLTVRGLATTAEQVLITQGAQHGWDLVLRSFARPGVRVLVEAPTYPAVLDAALAHRVRVLPLGVHEQGWDLEGLARRGQPVPALVHVTSEFQNPTGHHPGNQARRELLRALPEASVVVADETFADLGIDAGPAQRPMASLAARGRVVTLGSLSKTIWAGLRIGWVRATRDIVMRLATARTSQDLASPVLEQLLAVRLLGDVEEILAERRALLRTRRDHLLAALTRELPGWIPSRPSGGLVSWVDLGETSSTRLAVAAMDAGVRITPGPRFGLGGTHDRFLRLPFCLPEPDLDAAVARLALATSGLAADAVAGVADAGDGVAGAAQRRASMAAWRAWVA